MLSLVSNLFKGGIAFSLGVTALAMMPAAYIEIGCRGRMLHQQEPRFVPNDDWPRSEREVILGIPRHHMAFSYDDMAQAVTGGGAHEFGFAQSVRGYWGSLCAVLPVAEQVSETTKMERFSLYAQGVAFSFDMAIKGAYEESIGRLLSILTRNHLTAIEELETRTYSQIASHLHDRPWWEIDWDGLADKISAHEKQGIIRDNERLGFLWLSWKAKGEVASWLSREKISPPDRTELYVSWIDQEALTNVSDLRVEESYGQGYRLTIPRGDSLTLSVVGLLEQGGLIAEISGADDVMLTVLSDTKPIMPDGATVLATLKRPGFDRDRFVLRARTRSLSKLISTLKAGGDEIEMLIDY